MLSGFYYSKNGIAALSEIARVDDDHSQQGVRITTRDGKTTTGAGTSEDFMFRAVQIIPAEPGWSVIRAWKEGEKVEAIRTPVIAWALCADGETRVVTTSGLNDGSDMFHEIGPYVETAGGQIIGVGRDVEPWRHDSVESLATQTAEYDERRAAERAREDAARGAA